jgi:tryptophan synthase alpha chain
MNLMMNRIEKKFKELRAADKKAFIAFITAGYPNLEITEKLVVKLAQSGADIIELGVPFSDPLADGPIIQEASKAALDKNTHIEDILRVVVRARKATDIPICLMTYYNPVFCFGEEKFVTRAVQAGVDGAIIPDLPPEEARSFIASARENNLNTIFFIAPTSTQARIELIAKASTGFIYYVSLTGVTGPRAHLAIDFAGQLKLIKQHTDKPVCVGFGISSHQQVKLVEKFSDGVIVGSAIVNKIKENIGNPHLVAEVADFVRLLRGV